jgi:hypothetical protein
MGKNVHKQTNASTYTPPSTHTHAQTYADTHKHVHVHTQAYTHVKLQHGQTYQVGNGTTATGLPRGGRTRTSPDPPRPVETIRQRG